MRRLNWLMTVASCSVALSASIGAQTPAGKAPPAGKGVPVYRLRVLGVFDNDTGEPIEGVEVADALTGMKSLTTVTGTVSLLFLPEGGSLVRLRKVGYETQTFPVAISPADTQPMTVVMRHVTTLPTVNVKDSAPHFMSPTMRVFEERRKSGIGQFLTEDVFRKNEHMSLADLLMSRFSGMQVADAGAAGKFLLSSRTPCRGGALSICRHPNCYVSIYIDGLRIFDTSMAGTAPQDLGNLSPSDFAAAEFYAGPSELPVDVSPTSAQCGVLMLYTRSR